MPKESRTEFQIQFCDKKLFPVSLLSFSRFSASHSRLLLFTPVSGFSLFGFQLSSLCPCLDSGSKTCFSFRFRLSLPHLLLFVLVSGFSPFGFQLSFLSFTLLWSNACFSSRFRLLPCVCFCPYSSFSTSSTGQ